MKKTIKIACITLILLFQSLSAFADSADRSQFNGMWTGEIILTEGKGTVRIALEITDDKITQYFVDDNNKRATNPEDSNFLYARNNLVYAWVNKGGVWSETQIYSLSMINTSTLNVMYTRHVNNYRSGDNEAWHLQGEGTLMKEGPGLPFVMSLRKNVGAGNHQYQVIFKRMNWDDAKAHCESLGGHLATITSAEEQEYIINLLPQDLREGYWIGLHDRNVEGRWEWVTGEPLLYTNWNDGEPNDDGNGEDIVELTNAWGSWGWNDEKYPERYFICEWE
ncbi:MAG: C-type lectin domain-containing protein [Fusobacteriaceae bacterium]|jgi:hypothetical protein|nr:C-type lectin domain-containing protein [Fusobacteriaceae bacterium]